MLIEEGVADLDHAEHDQHQQRRHHRELDDALAARVFQQLQQRSHWNLPSFFIIDSTFMVIAPPGKNGESSGVINGQV